MHDLPLIVNRNDLCAYWEYRNEEGKVTAIVTRHQDKKKDSKKRFHQYHLDVNEQWVEGAPTPLPLYCIDTLPKEDSTLKVYIFEGEKCTSAAHHLGLAAITSMMGSGQAEYADWEILAKYRHVKDFVLIPDNDAAGQKYIKTVFDKLQKACPQSKISVCLLPLSEKGADLIDWIETQSACPSEWDGFTPIDDPNSKYLQHAFEGHVSQNLIDASKYFADVEDSSPTFAGDPEPIKQVLRKVLPCPMSTFPIEIRNWIRGFAQQMQVSEDYFAASLLVYLGSLIGRKRGLRLRPETNWVEHPNLWGMLVGRPSMMKSPAMKAVRSPLIVLADRAAKDHQNALKQYETNLEAWKIRKKVGEEVYKKSYKESLDGKSTSQSAKQFQIEEMPLEPKKRRYKTGDPTTEKLGELLIDNPQGLLLFRDELSGWLTSFTKIGRESDRQFFLESWSGNEDFDVDRIGRGSLHIPALCLSIFGSIQPGPLAHYIHAAVQGGAGDDGFIQRFQIMVWPDAKENWELVKVESIKSLESPVQKIFECLDTLTFDSEGRPTILSFDDEAQQMFDQWQNSFEKKMRLGILPPHLEAHLSKYKKLLPALCLIFEHINRAKEGVYPEVIEATTLQDSILWLDYLESHAHRIYDSGASSIPKTATELIERLRQGEIQEPFTARDVYYGHHWSGLTNAKQAEEVLDYLEEKNYLASRYIKTGGKPTTKYWVNPKIFEEVSC